MTDDFVSCLFDLDKPVKSTAIKAIYMLAKNPRHPSLHVEKIFDAIYTARLDLNYRIVHQLDAGKIRLLYVGTHDKAYGYTDKLQKQKISVVRERTIKYRAIKKKTTRRTIHSNFEQSLLTIGMSNTFLTPTGLIKIIKKILKKRKVR